MADNNKNPRRTIWLSETEPLSHYDIWLSKNQHLNSDGEPISTSGVLRDCDYIFKVWDCGDWHPIVGLNSTALNKINTVLNTDYTTTHDGHDINSSSYLEFHLPLFTSPNSSPLELFDAGTIGAAILEYVTEEEWENIFEGDTFNKVFKKYFKLIINEGDTNIINELLDPADYEYLGGVWADTFRLEDMFPDDATVPIGETEQQRSIEDSEQWLAQAKYKYEHGEDDYNLYISAKDIIRIVNKYEDENPEAPGILPSDDFEWRYAGHELVGGIWADTFNMEEVFPDDTNIEELSQDDIQDSLGWIALAKYTHASINQRDDYNLYVNAKDIINIIKEYQEDNPDEPGLIDIDSLEDILKNSPTIGVLVARHVGEPPSVKMNIWGSYAAINVGKILKIKNNPHPPVTTEWDLNNNIVDWTTEYDIVTEGTGYTTDSTKKYLSCQDGTFGWETIDTGNTYYGSSTIYINPTNNEISIMPYTGGPGEVYLRSINGNVSWQPIDTGEIYEVLGEHSSANEEYVIRGGSNDKYYLNGNGEWTEPPGIDYQNGSGITINNQVIEVTGASVASEGQVLTSDGRGDVTWALPNFDTYSAGEGISIDDTENTNEKEISIVSPKGNGTTEPFELGGIKAQDISDVYRANPDVVDTVMIPVYRKPDTIEGTDNPEKGFLCVDKRGIGPEIIEYELIDSTVLGVTGSGPILGTERLISYNLYLVPSNTLALTQLTSITLRNIDINGEAIIFANCDSRATIIFEYGMFLVPSISATNTDIDTSGSNPVFTVKTGGWMLITLRKNTIKIEDQLLIQQTL